MGNRSGRRRPRKHSFRFGPLRWVLVREAAMRVIYPFPALPHQTGAMRSTLSGQQTHHIIRDVQRMLQREPWRAIYPQPELPFGPPRPTAEHSHPLPATTEPPLRDA